MNNLYYLIQYIFLSLPCFSCVSLHVVDNASSRHFTHPALDLQPAVAHPCSAHSAIAHPWSAKNPLNKALVYHLTGKYLQTTVTMLNDVRADEVGAIHP
jgi:hypothetical protein